MPSVLAGVRFAAVLLAWPAVLVTASASLAQSAPSPSPEGKTPSPATGTHEMQLKEDDELYILKDLPEPKPAEPKLDLGKVGKKGKLSLEGLPLDGGQDPVEKPRRGGGVRLRIPLGKNAP